MKAFDARAALDRHNLMKILGIPMTTSVTFDRSLKGVGREAEVLRMPVDPADGDLLMADGALYQFMMPDYHEVDGPNPLQ